MPPELNAPVELVTLLGSHLKVVPVSCCTKEISVKVDSVPKQYLRWRNTNGGMYLCIHNALY